MLKEENVFKKKENDLCHGRKEDDIRQGISFDLKRSNLISLWSALFQGEKNASHI